MVLNEGKAEADLSKVDIEMKSSKKDVSESLPNLLVKTYETNGSNMAEYELLAAELKAEPVPLDANGNRRVTIGGEDCIFLNDDEYRKVRQEWKVPDKFLAMFDFGKLKAGGGKGGNPLAFTCNRTVIVKEIAGSDQDKLLLNSEVFTKYSLTDTFMVRFFCHFQRVKTGKYYVAMNNCLPISPGTKWHAVYDLKGCRDDKLLVSKGESVVEIHKRCFHCYKCWYMGCCSTPERRAYYDGKNHAFECTFHVTPAQYNIITEKINRDCNFLERQNVMDHSLIVGVLVFNSLEEAKSLPAGASGDDLQPFVAQHDGKIYAYYLGVIDFLQEWTFTKKIAALIKAAFAPKPASTVPPQRYSTQFRNYFTDKFIGDAEPVDLGEEVATRRASRKGHSTIFNAVVEAQKNGTNDLGIGNGKFTSMLDEARLRNHSTRSMAHLKEGKVVPPRVQTAGEAPKANATMGR
eukprot:g2037.t1